MIKLKITNKNNFLYNLTDESQNNYSLNLEFLDIEEIPEVGDNLFLSAELLNPKYAGYSTMYTFGDLESEYGKKDISIDIIKIEKNDKEII